MTIYLGDFPTGKTIYVPFHTFNSSGASVTITGLAVTDIEVYRNGSVTQRASDAGYALLDTDGIDFDGLTGIHGFSIDTSDNTDSGFYAAGYDYWVVVSAITVDAQTVSFVAAIFSIDNRQLLRPTTASRTLDVTTTGEAGLDFGNVNLPVGSIPIVNIIENGTMQSGSAAGTAVLRSATSFVDDLIIGATIIVTGGTGAGQSRIIHDWVSTTDTASISPNWTTTPDNTSTYLVIPTPPAPTNAAALATTLISTGTGAGQVNLSSGAVPVTGDFTATMKTSIGTAVAASAVASVTGAVGSVTGNVGGNVAGSVGSVTGAVGSVTGAVGSVTGNVGGNVVGSVGSVTGGATAASLNATRYAKNTASQKVYFTLVDSTDHVTRKTGITVTAQRSLDGAAFGSATGTVTEVGSGVYYLSTSTADINADDVVFRFTGTACDPVELHVVTY